MSSLSTVEPTMRSPPCLLLQSPMSPTLMQMPPEWTRWTCPERWLALSPKRAPAFTVQFGQCNLSGSKRICAQALHAFERRLSSRRIGTFSPLGTLLRASCIARRVRFLACFLLSKPAVSMRADAFPPCFPCAGTTAAKPRRVSRVACRVSPKSSPSRPQSSDRVEVGVVCFLREVDKLCRECV